MSDLPPALDEFDRAVQCAVRARSDRVWARQCRGQRRFFDARQAESDARWHESAVRKMADAILSGRPHS